MTSSRSSRLTALLALGFVAGLASLLASFPARNTDLWGRLAAGRAVAAGSLTAASSGWLFDLTAYALYSLAGGVGLVVAKAAVVAAAAVVIARLSRTSASGGWLVPVACTVLAVLASGSRLLLQPATVSILFLALAMRLALRDDRPGWRLAVLFLLWANVDRWFLAGLGVVGLLWLGRGLDGRRVGEGGRSWLRGLTAFALLVAVTLLNPAHLHGPLLPAELVGGSPLSSPFSRAYLEAFARNPAGLAFYPLFGLGLLSFLVAPVRWERLLPWAGLAALAAVQARTVPLFAVVAGPVLAWNLQDFFAARAAPMAARRRGLRAVGEGLVAVLAVAFLVAAWPGWLQGPPYGRRAWTADPPPGVEEGATAVRGLAGVWPADTRTLHVSADTAAGFAWFAPDDPAVVIDKLAAALTDREADPVAALKAAKVSRVVASAADRRPRAAFDLLLADPGRWPLLHLAGGLAVFGVRDPAAPPDADPYRGREVDFAQAAFHPSAEEVAPPGRPDGEAGPQRWWDAFRRPLPPPPADRAQASALLVKAELLRQTAPAEHFRTWQAVQAAGLVAATAAAPGPADTAFRLTLVQPPPPAEPGAQPPPVAANVFALQRWLAFTQGDTPTGVLYLAVRAARRAVAANPADATAYLALGEAYLRLLSDTRERAWAAQFPTLSRLRQVQAVAALTRAVELNPASAAAHLRLGRLYEGQRVYDLMYAHLRRYRDLTAAGGAAETPSTVPPPTADELKEMGEFVAKLEKEFEAEAARARVYERAQAAVRRGLIGRGRDILLGSDVSAFGDAGMRLELSLLLRTGRADDVIAWTGPELAPALGDEFNRLRGQALAAVGEYAKADAELAELSGADRPVERPAVALSFARVTGRAVLDGAGAATWPGAVWRAFGLTQFEAAGVDIANPLAERSSMTALRGLVALEAGDVRTAEAAFRAATQFGTPDGAGLRYPGRLAAEDALKWLTAAGAK